MKFTSRVSPVFTCISRNPENSIERKTTPRPMAKKPRWRTKDRATASWGCESAIEFGSASDDPFFTGANLMRRPTAAQADSCGAISYNQGGGYWDDMESEDLIDEKALIERIRERLRPSLDSAPLPPLAPRPAAPVDRSSETLDSELASMAAAADIGHVRLRSYRKLLGPL